MPRDVSRLRQVHLHLTGELRSEDGQPLAQTVLADLREHLLRGEELTWSKVHLTRLDGDGKEAPGTTARVEVDLGAILEPTTEQDHPLA